MEAVSLKKADIITKLRDDNEYYNGLGLEFMSNSDIKLLLESPRTYNAIKTNPELRIKTLPMVLGSFLHISILEPEKVDDKFIVVDARTRNTNRYKDMAQENPDKDCLLIREYDNMMACVKRVKGNSEVRELLNGVTEEPNVGEMFGINFKCKADVFNKERGLVVDIKTTSDINGFKYSCNKYFYNSQAYIYTQLFGVENFKFIAIDKNTKDIGIFTATESFFDKGFDLTQRAVDIYMRFFDNETFEEVEDYIIKEDLI